MRDSHKVFGTLVLSLVGGLLLAGLGVGTGLGLPVGGTGESVVDRTAERPNIVFVLTDDQMPGTEDRMPALQGNVAGAGVEFSGTVSTYPLCCPGRAVLQRGQYPHNTEIYGNSEPRGGWEKFRRLGLQKSTVATWLDGSGYQTGLFGKYMNNYRGRMVPPGWDRWYAWNGEKMGWTSVNDQGAVRDLDRRQADVAVAENAARFLENRVDDRAPVFAFVGFGAMHQPFPHDPEDRKKFKGANVPRTPAFNEADVSDKNADVRREGRLTGAEISALDQDYRRSLRSLQRVDRFIGRAAGILRESGELDNTYFVFYTDNGAHFGQHRLAHGKLQPYEEDINFPLIISGPDIRRGAVEPRLVGNHDIAPTIADMANAPDPAFVDGRSVLPLARNGAAPWPRTAILSIREPDLAPPRLWEVLRMRDEKYVRFQNGGKEYYDLRADPHELRSDPGSPAPGTRAYWEKRMDDLGDCSGSACRAAENAPALPPPAAP